MQQAASTHHVETLPGTALFNLRGTLQQIVSNIDGLVLAAPTHRGEKVPISGTLCLKYMGTASTGHHASKQLQPVETLVFTSFASVGGKRRAIESAAAMALAYLQSLGQALPAQVAEYVWTFECEWGAMPPSKPHILDTIIHLGDQSKTASAVLRTVLDMQCGLKQDVGLPSKPAVWEPTQQQRQELQEQQERAGLVRQQRWHGNNPLYSSEVTLPVLAGANEADAAEILLGFRAVHTSQKKCKNAVAALVLQYLCNHGLVLPWDTASWFKHQFSDEDGAKAWLYKPQPQQWFRLGKREFKHLDVSMESANDSSTSASEGEPQSAASEQVPRPAAPLEDMLTGLSVAPPMAMPTGTATDMLVWFDILTTGPDPARDRIVQMAALMTDWKFNLVAEGPCITIQQRTLPPPPVLTPGLPSDTIATDSLAALQVQPPPPTRPKPPASPEEAPAVEAVQRLAEARASDPIIGRLVKALLHYGRGVALPTAEQQLQEWVLRAVPQHRLGSMLLATWDAATTHKFLQHNMPQLCGLFKSQQGPARLLDACSVARFAEVFAQEQHAAYARQFEPLKQHDLHIGLQQKLSELRFCCAKVLVSEAGESGVHDGTSAS